jgi:pimeloyl-ACP methyl ester carboxylesterase
MKPIDSYANNGEIKLWTESFGNSTDPSILLIIGAGSQSILWPDEFCKKLANQGFFVIRYDNRDTGKSSAIDYAKNPYTIMDMAKDSLAVLDHYNINQANIIGFSMGGQIAQFIGAYFPERAKTITLMATSTSFEEGFNAFAGKYDGKGLSAPKDHYVKWATKATTPNQTYEQKLSDFVHSWKLLNGDKTPFDEALYKQIAENSFARSNLDNPYPQHAYAMKASYNEHKEAPGKINLPTLIIHGEEDPVFGVDHAEALHKNIRGSKLEVIKGMGHNLNTRFYDPLINLIKNHCKKNA